MKTKAGSEGLLPLVIPAAGIGSRLFPITWAVPKELLPINNKPVLHYVLAEAMEASIREVICITSPRKESLISYLTYNHKQNVMPLSHQERVRLDELDKLNHFFSYHFCLQSKPYGVGHAIIQAKKYIHSDFFCIAYPDDILVGIKAGFSQMISVHNKYKASVILIEKVDPQKIHLYGVVGYSAEIEPGVFEVTHIVEKPSKESAPSLYGIIGRYIISTKMFELMEEQKISNPCNIVAFNELIKRKYRFIGVEVIGKRYDIGTLDGWLATFKSINQL